MSGPADGQPESDAPPSGSMRLDKWLWYVRVIKSRTQAAELVATGKVRLNRVRIEKPSQPVRVGDVVTVAVGPRVRVLKVLAPGQRRGPPSEARLLYEDLTPEPSTSAAERGTTPLPGGHRDPGEGRPTKRDRRLIDRLRPTED